MSKKKPGAWVWMLVAVLSVVADLCMAADKLLESVPRLWRRWRRSRETKKPRAPSPKPKPRPRRKRS